MSFINVFEELNKLYESAEPEIREDQTEETAEELTEETAEEVEEATEEETAEEEVAEEPADEEVRQLILECANCGAIAIKAEPDTVTDEESDLANVDEACQYCEEAAGYKIIGVVAPYGEADAEDVEEEFAEDEDMTITEEEPVEESLLDVNLPIDVDVQANGNDVSVGTLG